MLSGTPNIMGILATQEGVRLVDEAGIDAIRAKSVALTEYLLEIVDRLRAKVKAVPGADVSMFPASGMRMGGRSTRSMSD